jgi:hypothetical protein
MTFWKVEVKYHKIAIPDVILFSDEKQARDYQDGKDTNGMVVWTGLEKVEVTIKPIPMTE